MFLTEKNSPFPSFSPFRSSLKRSPLHDFDLIFRTFDDKLASRLKALAFSSPSPSVSLQWLSLAVDLLSDTHADASAVISAMTAASGSSADSRAFYLDHSVKVLDVCNSISYEIEKLRHRRLLMDFAVHLLKSSGNEDAPPAPEKLKRAGECIADYERNSRDFAKRRGFEVREPDVLIRDLQNAIVTISPRGKISTVERAVLRIIYAVGLITVFVAGVALSSLHGLPELAKIRVPSEFSWSDSVNELRTAIFDSDGRVVLTEIDDVAARAVSLRVLIDGGVSEVGERARLESAVKEMEMVTEKMSVNLDRLDNGVNKMFGVVLSVRNGVLDNYRVGPVEKRHK
ncbi:hypothetical protein ACET3Z_002305 [Daucus carota]